MNYRAGTLKGKVGIVNESRHSMLIEMTKQKSVAGIYFPEALRNFSVSADRKLIQACPDDFLLTGSIDTAVAMGAKPDVLAWSYNTPILDCAANTWRSAERSMCFYPKDEKLSFDGRRLDAYKTFSGGLLFVG